METAIIIFFISVGLVVVVPILLLIIQGIRNYFRKRKRQKSTYQKTEDKIAEASRKQSTYQKTEEKIAEASRTEPVHKDSGRNVQAVSEAAGYGEFQIYECLKDYEKQGCKFLFNVYLPKNNGETTEIDVLMISSKGVFVFESKNLSGNIVGSEKDQFWVQTTTDDQGERINRKFFNPIMQNDIHILSLRSVINFEYPVHSIVVFSDICTLYDDASLNSGDTRVITMSDLEETVGAFYKYMSSDLSDSDIETVYNSLYKYTQVSDKVKSEHIKNIQDKYQSENNIYQ